MDHEKPLLWVVKFLTVLGKLSVNKYIASILFCIFCLSGCSDSTNNVCDSDCIAGLYLSEIADNLILHRSMNFEGQREAEKMIFVSIARKVVMISAASPNIDNIKGNDLETLCFLNQYLDDLKKNIDEGMYLIVKDYLLEIEGDANEILRNSQVHLRGRGCLMSPGSKMQLLQEMDP